MPSHDYWFGRGAIIALAVTLLFAGCLNAPQEVANGQGSGQSQGGGEDPTPSIHPPPNQQNSSTEPPVPSQQNSSRDPRVWASVEEATIRPGNHINYQGCTANFVFLSPYNNSLYLGTAAHCLGTEGVNPCDPDGPAPWPPGRLIPVAGASTPARIAYSSFYSSWSQGGQSCEGRSNDFALLEIDPRDHHRVNPAMRNFGGPTALSDPATIGDKVLSYGGSALRLGPAEALDPREGYVTKKSAWFYHVYFATPAVFGDSGSPVMTADGRAIGIMHGIDIMHGGIDLLQPHVPQSAPGSNTVVNLHKALEFAEDQGWPVELATWDLLDGGILP